MAERIGERLSDYLRFIHQFTEVKGFPPTIKEIADNFGIKPPSALAHIVSLESAGYIKRSPKQWRSIQVIEPPSFEVPVKKMIQIPVVGRVAAGTPILAAENIEDHIRVDSELARFKGDLFALKVKGDSMTGANIKDGDYLIVRQQPVADDGDIVVALLGDEGTVKRLHMRDDRVELLPENPRHKPIKVERGDEFRIVGKALAVYRMAGALMKA